MMKKQCTALRLHSPHLLVLLWSAVLGTALLGAVSPPVHAQTTTVETPAAVPEVPGDLDFDMDTAEFENFGDEGFVVEEPLDPTTGAAITAIQVVIGLAVVFGLLWLVRRIFSGKRTS